MLSNIIRNEVRKGATDPYVRRVATDIIKQNNIDGHDQTKILRAFQQYFHNNIKYVYDPRLRGYERIQSAHITLPYDKHLNPTGLGSGDCDCLSTAFGSMAKSVGMKDVHLALIGQRQKGIYGHILPVWNQDGTPLRWNNVTAYELTRKRPYKYKPPCKSVGFIDLNQI